MTMCCIYSPVWILTVCHNDGSVLSCPFIAYTNVAVSVLLLTYAGGSVPDVQPT